MTDQSAEALEAAANLLETSKDYRVLRRLKPSLRTVDVREEEIRLGLFVDVETTGLDFARDEIIELAMLPFRYSLNGSVIEVLEPFDHLREPAKPIPSSITALTGITDAIVVGHSIDSEEVSLFANSAHLIVAHNAGFDRKFIERLYPIFSSKPWACSMLDIDWAAEGFEGTKLSYLAAGFGFFYDRHRALNDCLAAVELLSLTLPKSGTSALAHLLARARQSTWRIWAENSPFECKNQLKERGYRWNGNENGLPRSWYIDVSNEQREDELAFLKREIYKREVNLKSMQVTAYERYSERA